MRFLLLLFLFFCCGLAAQAEAFDTNVFSLPDTFSLGAHAAVTDTRVDTRPVIVKTISYLLLEKMRPAYMYVYKGKNSEHGRRGFHYGAAFEIIQGSTLTTDTAAWFRNLYLEYGIVSGSFVSLGVGYDLTQWMNLSAGVAGSYSKFKLTGHYYPMCMFSIEVGNASNKP